MKRRFFCDQIPEAGAVAELAAAESHHLRTVLRARNDEPLILLDGRGTSADARVLNGANRSGPVRVEILARETAPAPVHSYGLYVAPPRGKGMAQIVRQATELGAGTIQPVLCDRSESRPPPSAAAAWQRAVREACKQSGNPFCPEIRAPRPLMELLDAELEPGYVGWTGPAPEPPRQFESRRLSLWIGPEGGFSPAELEALMGQGLAPLNLARWTLRVETAAAAGLAWLNERYPQ